jgi:hypothetical protein
MDMFSTAAANADATGVDPCSCPLCGQPNGCAMVTRDQGNRETPPCWCVGASFPPELLARVPAEAKRRACICAACAAGATAQV